MKRLARFLASRKTVPWEGNRVGRPGRANARGQAFALLAVMSSALFAFAGLGINTSADEATQMKAQAASDAAGVSAARQWASDITTYSLTGAPQFQSNCASSFPNVCTVDATDAYTSGGVEPAVFEAGQLTKLNNLTTINLNYACVFSSGSGSSGSLHVAFFGSTMTSSNCSSSYTTANSSSFERVDVYIPPLNPPSLCSPNTWRCIQVDVAQNTNQVFGGSLGTSSVKETASSTVYQPPTTTVTTLPCGLCTLGTSGTNIYEAGGASITVNNASILTNSTASPAISVSAGSGGGAATMTSTGTNSGIDIATGGTLSCGGTCNPGTATPSSVIPDPYANVPAPAMDPSSPLLSFSCSGGGTYTLHPGVYSSFTAGGNCNVQLDPGVYVIESAMTLGGNVDVDNSAKVDATPGVMLYFTCAGYTRTNTTPCGNSQSSDTACHNYGLDINSTNATINLTPPSSGVYQGMGIFYDRTLNGYLCLGGGSAPSLGTVYAKSATVSINGNAGTESAIVCNSLQMAGSSTLTIDGSVSGGAAPMNNGTYSSSSYAQIAG